MAQLLGRSVRQKAGTAAPDLRASGRLVARPRGPFLQPAWPVARKHMTYSPSCRFARCVVADLAA
jgi:hypothetical protein